MRRGYINPLLNRLLTDYGKGNGLAAIIKENLIARIILFAVNKLGKAFFFC